MGKAVSLQEDGPARRTYTYNTMCEEPKHIVEERVLGIARRSKSKRLVKVTLESSVYGYGLVRPRVEPWLLHKARLAAVRTTNPGATFSGHGDVVAPATDDVLPYAIQEPLPVSALSFWAWADLVAFGLWPYVLLAFNHTLQLGTAYYIYHLATQNETGTCNSTPFFARFCTLGTFMVVVVKDLYGTASLGFWIWNQPREKEWRWLSHINYSDGSTTETGMTRGFFYASWLLVVLPKVAIAVLLATFGGGYLLKSPNVEAVILHTVTLCFILSIDEAMFELFTSSFDKELLQEVKPIYITLHHFNGLEYYLGGWLRAMLVIVACYAVYLGFCA